MGNCEVMLSFNKPGAIIAHGFSWQVNVGGTIPAADNLECRVNCWPNGAPGGWDKDEVWWGRVRACQYGAEAFQQQRQRQTELHTEEGLKCWNPAEMQSFPGKSYVFFIGFGVKAALCTKAYFFNRERIPFYITFDPWLFLHHPIAAVVLE